MDPCELTLSITALANAIACKLSDENLDLVAAAVSQLGDTLATISAQRSRCKTICGRSSASSVSAGSTQSGG